jgi:uncharacterized protein YcbK (DUF882 family)
MPSPLDARLPSRRRFLATLAAPAVAGALMTLPALPAEAAAPVRRISFRHLHTGEMVDRAVYFADGHYVAQNMRQISHVLRDWRTDEILAYDPRLMDLLFALQRRLRTSEPFDIVCGYRCPETNAMLRRMSRGVAKHSLHMKAMAIDLRMPGRALRDVRNAAAQLKLGGVGYYPASDFVHVDTGPVRYW